jgi:(2Fe-2S) ferredoxin
VAGGASAGHALSAAAQDACVHAVCSAHGQTAGGPSWLDFYNRAMSYYERHVFFCLNQRENGEACCGNHEPEAAFNHCKRLVKKAGIAGVGQVRVNRAGCLDRCAGAPVVVVYPEATWYSYVDLNDIEEIVESHLKGGVVVERLRLAPEVGR